MMVRSSVANGHFDRITQPAMESIEPCALRNGNILDIRRGGTDFDLVNDIREGLSPENGAEKTLPTLLLYDEKGLKLFEDITYLSEYYLTNTEIEVLENHCQNIADSVPAGSVLVELGSGNLRKIKILLDAIERQGKTVVYFALDVSERELERTLAQIPANAFRHVKCYGLLGTYDDGLEWLKHSDLALQPKVVISLGSSIGNFTRPAASSFLKGFAEILHHDDFILVAVDGCTDGDKIYHAYNDREGVTHSFILNGLTHANRLMDKPAFNLEDWKVIGEYDEKAGKHHAFLSPTRPVEVEGTYIDEGERIRIEESHKYDEKRLQGLWQAAGVAPYNQWSSRVVPYAMHMIKKQEYAFDLDPQVYAARPVPSWEEWVELWKLWDTVTLGMISDDDLLKKPIKLRNACIFYLGHIPTFLDMKLAESTDGTHTNPEQYTRIFERGIDPDVDNPEKCHKHSEIPDEWPTLAEILDFQKRVRQRVHRYYETQESENPKIARTLWLGYEHECMHLETLLYMLLQSDRTLAPPKAPKPDFEHLALDVKSKEVENEWFEIPASDVTIGLEDPETVEGPPRYFGWDIEKPSRKAHVPAFRAKGRPISIEDYARFLHGTHNDSLPASWDKKKHTNGHANGHDHANGVKVSNDHREEESFQSFLNDKSVRTVYGGVPLSQALSWPVAASYDELAAYASWVGGRIPSFEETKSIYNLVEATKAKEREAQKALGKTIPAVNSHLINDGVEESPPSHAPEAKSSGANGTADPPQPNPLNSFASLQGANVGFQRWHPSSVTPNGGRLSGQGDMGGLWEWTSTPLRKHKGYEPMPLYPAYSQDFFDEKHNIVLGGSWATAPRLAGRKTFINWYQRNYPYAWAGARVVQDK